MAPATLWARRVGWALAIFSAVAPALPFGPLFAQPPWPMAPLWLAFGLATTGGVASRAMLALFAIGIVHDQFAGGPFGLFALIYVSAYLFGWVAARAMSAPNLIALWGGFIATAGATVILVAVIAPLTNAPTWPYLQTAAITALLFPLVRPLYMDRPGASRISSRFGAGR
ncbi:MAG: hypothetical protein ACOYKM_13585 [Caulobacterales bacterium]|jgi:hypothetical protein